MAWAARKVTAKNANEKLAHRRLTVRKAMASGVIMIIEPR
jgi:hypothetical protein